MPRPFDFALNQIHSGVKQMTFKRPYSAGLAALAVGLFAATAAYAEPTVNKGDNAWMLTSTVLVLLLSLIHISRPATTNSRTPWPWHRDS